MRRRATLPHPLGCSTIAVPGLSFRVRNGVRASHLGHGRRKSSILLPALTGTGDGPGWRSGNRRMDAMFRCSALRDHALPVAGDAACRGRCVVDCPSSVSTGQLHPSRGFHVRPINHVFCMGTAAPEGAWNPYLGAGFPLRCFQRLSLPNVANQPRHWRDDWHTRGSSTQVLSYYGQASSRFRRAQRIETKLSHDVLNPARVPL